ncbi:MAG: phytanoyl-CoA dioxygenase family protein [bacterium]|nr:phytanoyl-CoA dioxygenase family protein [bacterium]
MDMGAAPSQTRYRLVRFVKHRIMRPVFDVYYSVRASELVMDTLVRGEQQWLTEHPPELSIKERGIIKALSTDGIAITSLTELGFPEYLERVRAFIASRKTRSLGLKKKFLEYIWGEGIEPFEPENPFNQLALEPRVTSLTGAYVNYRPLFYFTSANRTLPSSVARGSQQWHMDPTSGDKRILKLFLYVTDVTPENGPFEYVKRTCRSAKNPVFALARSSYQGVYPKETELDPSTVEKNLVSAQGPAGTVVFCDTSGIHRGGFGLAGGRVMATAAYTSRFSIQGSRFTNSGLYKKTYQLK